MRPNQQNNNNKNRSRNRNSGRKHVNPLSRNYESNGPDVKVRGNAAHVAEKYTQLARDAQSSGDSVMAENYLQHAEHYFRILMAGQPQQQRQENGQDSDEDFEGDENDVGNRFASRSPRPQNTDGDGDNDQPNHQQQNSYQQHNNNQQQPSHQPQQVSEPAVVARAADTPASENGEATVDGETPRKRERRPRRRRASGGEGGSDPASAPQPDIGELPAFITAGGTAAE